MAPVTAFVPVDGLDVRDPFPSDIVFPKGVSR